MDRSQCGLNRLALCGIRLCVPCPGRCGWAALQRREGCTLRAVPGAGEICFGSLEPGDYLLTLGGRGRPVRLIVRLPPGGCVELCWSPAAGQCRWRPVWDPFLLRPAPERG